MIFDIKHVFGRKAEETQQTLTQAQQSIQSAVEQPAQRMYQAESDLKAAFARLQQHAVTGGEALIRMLHSLDKPSITLDIKWRDMQEQLAGNKDVRSVHLACNVFPIALVIVLPNSILDLMPLTLHLCPFVSLYKLGKPSVDTECFTM